MRRLAICSCLLTGCATGTPAPGDGSAIDELQNAEPKPEPKPDSASEGETPGPDARPEVEATPTVAPEAACSNLIATADWKGRGAIESWVSGIYSRDKVPAGTVILTFDDGPNASKTPRLLDAMKEHGMSATFFIVGRSVKPTNYHLLRRMIDEGHSIGNHTYQHDIELASRGGKKSVAYVEAEFRLTQAMVDIALLAESPEDFEALVLRMHAGKPPYKPSPTKLIAAWPGIAERHAEIMKERGREAGDHPYAMVYARGPNGYPFLGNFTSADREAYARALINLGLLNVMYHRNDMKGAMAGMLEAAAKGGVFVTHDWGKIDTIEKAISKLAADPALSAGTLDSVTMQKYGCSPQAASAAILAGNEAP
jgi:hypothetical protein